MTRQFVKKRRKNKKAPAAHKTSPAKGRGTARRGGGGVDLRRARSIGGAQNPEASLRPRPSPGGEGAERSEADEVDLRRARSTGGAQSPEAPLRPRPSLGGEGAERSEADEVDLRRARSIGSAQNPEAPPHPSSGLRETPDATFSSRRRLGDAGSSHTFPQGKS